MKLVTFNLKPKLVSAAGLAPAVSRFQAGHVAATLHAETPNDFGERRSGETRGCQTLGINLAVRCEIGAPSETRTRSLPADNGLLCYSAMGANGGKRW